MPNEWIVNGPTDSEVLVRAKSGRLPNAPRPLKWALVAIHGLFVIKRCALGLAVLLGLSACSDAGQQGAPGARAGALPGQTLADVMKTKLFQGEQKILIQERDQLREARTGGDHSPDRWPQCDSVAQAYAKQAEKIRSMVGIQEMILAGDIDDFVLCDQPQIADAIRPTLLATIKQLAPDQDAAKAFEYLRNHPVNDKKLGDCWLRELRSARESRISYRQANQQTFNTCTTQPESAVPGQGQSNGKQASGSPGKR